MTKGIFFILSAAAAALLPLGTGAAESSAGVVGVVGLGQMGKAIVQCYDQHGFEVHAWNRGTACREQVEQEFHDKTNVKVHDKLEDVLASTDLIIMAIMGGTDLKNANELVQSVSDKKRWKDKTLVQYSAHEPTSAKQHENLIESLGAHLIAGAMMAMPEDVCGEGMFFVASTQKGTLETVVPTLEKMGTLVKFERDVGLASLADIGVLQTVYFGMSGLELALLLMERYGAPASFQKYFLEFSKEVIPTFFPVLADQVTHVIWSKKWTESVDTKEMVTDAFDVWISFLKKMGVVEDTFLHAFYKYLQLIPNKKDAMSRWIEFATTDKPNQEEL